jgi:hypothetical protein
MIGALILAGEAAFWVFVLGGLAARYLLRRPRLGAALLLMTPVVDLALVVATVVDLRAGATAGAFHGLAAVYVGVSVAFGRRMIRWTDGRFAHRFAGGPAPRRPPRHGPEHARREREGWYRHLLAWALGSALMLGMVLLVGDAERTESLSARVGLWTLILAVDFVWSFSYALRPSEAKSPRDASAQVLGRYARRDTGKERRKT